MEQQNQLTAEQKIEKIKSVTHKQCEAIIAEAKQLSERCKSIKITDEGTLAMANQLLSTTNQLKNKAEAGRKKMKAPYIDAGKAIDAVLNENIIDPLEEAIAFGKKMISEFNEAQKKLAQAANEKNQKIYAALKGMESALNAKLGTISEPEQCEKLIEDIKTKWPKATAMGQYANESETARASFLKALEAKKQFLLGKTTEQPKEVVSEPIIYSPVAQVVAPKSNVRRVAKFEVIDEATIPRSLLSLDESKIREYIKSKKEIFDKMLSEGKTETMFGGVRIYFEEIPVIR